MIRPHALIFPGEKQTGTLTIREYFAAIALQGLISSGMAKMYSKDILVNDSIQYADLLIKKLNGE